MKACVMGNRLAPAVFRLKVMKACVMGNWLAPAVARLKVMKACVMSTVLYNCEAFGPNIPEGLEEIYHKMLRAALDVRTNCPKLIILMESGCLPLHCIIRSRIFFADSTVAANKLST